MTRTLAFSVIVVLVASCAPSDECEKPESYEVYQDPAYREATLLIRGSAFDPAVGTEVFVALGFEGELLVDEPDTTVLSDGAFSIDITTEAWFEDVMYAIDLNGNGRCDPPPTDIVKQLSVDARAGGNITVAVSPVDADAPMACDSINAVLEENARVPPAPPCHPNQQSIE